MAKNLIYQLPSTWYFLSMVYLLHCVLETQHSHCVSGQTKDDYRKENVYLSLYYMKTVQIGLNDNSIQYPPPSTGLNDDDNDDNVQSKTKTNNDTKKFNYIVEYVQVDHL